MYVIMVSKSMFLMKTHFFLQHCHPPPHNPAVPPRPPRGVPTPRFGTTGLAWHVSGWWWQKLLAAHLCPAPASPPSATPGPPARQPGSSPWKPIVLNMVNSFHALSSPTTSRHPRHMMRCRNDKNPRTGEKKRDQTYHLTVKAGLPVCRQRFCSKHGVWKPQRHCRICFFF